MARDSEPGMYRAKDKYSNTQLWNNDGNLLCVCLCVWMTDPSASDAVKKKTVQGAACKRFLERADGEIFSEAVVTSLTICFSINFRCVFIDCFAYSTQFCL